MANDIIVKSTLAFLFPGNAAQPTLADMGRFVKSLNGDRAMMDTAYKISDEKSVFIRFKSEEAMQFCFENNPAILLFRYTDGREVKVNMSVAGGNTRYVRVYDLPPEATDRDLSAVLGKYGQIKRIVRERFPADTGLDMYSGVRGLYMDIQSDIPEILHFRGRKGRISYDGVKLKCYVCKADGHLKKACPIFIARRAEGEKHQREQQQQEPQSNQQVSASSVEAGTGEAAAPGASSITGKQLSKQVKSKNRTMETKRQLSIDSNTSSQPTEKKKTNLQPDRENDDNVMVTDIVDDGQSESEPIDWTTATPGQR